MSQHQPFYILFRHTIPGEPVRHSIHKEYDDGKTWGAPTLTVVEYYDSYSEARTALTKTNGKEQES